jgi:hypothetical protein
MPGAWTARCAPPPLLAGAVRSCLGILVRAVAALAVWTSAVPTALGQQQLSDQQLKAAYVLNFIRYTEWPERTFAATDSPLVICVLGDPGIAGLAGMAGKTIKGRPLQVRAAVSADDARGCHALFIPEADARRFVGTLRALQSTPVLTIGEADGFIDIGGMIGLVHFDNRLQFEVNLGVLQQAQLKASSQLLRLARNVIEARPR